MIYVDEVGIKGDFLGENVYKIRKFNYIPYDSDKI